MEAFYPPTTKMMVQSIDSDYMETTRMGSERTIEPTRQVMRCTNGESEVTVFIPRPAPFAVGDQVWVDITFAPA